MPTFGDLVSMDAQSSRLLLMQSAATTVTTGTVASVDGFNGVQNLELQETAGGTATVQLQGSMDGTVWYAAGYQQVDSVADPMRSVTAISVTANTAHVYEVLDGYRLLRANITAISAASVTARVYVMAV